MDLETLRAKLREALTSKPKAWVLLGEVNAALAEDKGDFALRSELEHAKTALSEYYDGPWINTYGAKSFKDLQAAADAQEKAHEVGELTEAYRQIIGNIMYGDETPAAKVTALRQLSDEFMGLVSTALNVTAEAARPKPAGDALAESVAGADVTLLEGEALTNGARSPLDINVKLIKPGWGNRRDNHYYPADVLKRDAKMFEGVKMYATDHNAAEKNVRTEVSQIKSITGFDTDGAPIARVTVFDPSFAEMVRNRAAAGALDSLECSILAYGSAKKGTAPDGREGNIVEAITAAQSVDWVTKAGAGGQALSLAESAANADKGETPMLTEAEKKRLLAESGLHPAAQARLAAGQYADVAALTSAIGTEKAYLREVEVGSEDLAAIRGMLEKATAAITALEGAAAPAPAAAPAAADNPPPPQKVAAEAVTAELEKSGLPAASQARLSEASYDDAEALKRAIVAERDYLKTVTGSGRPVSRAAAEPAVRTLAERDAAANTVLDKTFGPRPARK